MSLTYFQNNMSQKLSYSDMLAKAQMTRRGFIPFRQTICYYSSQNVQRFLYDMKKAYIRLLPEDDRIQISFHYTKPEFKVDRDFNFSRDVNETINVCLERMKNNLEKTFKKKPKKKNIKKVTEDQDQSVANVVAQETTFEIPIQVLKNNVSVGEKKFDELFGDNKDVTGLVLRICTDDFEIVYNLPWVINLQLPNKILSGYYLYPNKMEIKLGATKYSNGVWFRGKLQPSKSAFQITDWEQVHEGLIYFTRPQDIGYYIKFQLIPGNGIQYGPAAETISKNCVQVGPENCPFEERHLYTKYLTQNDEFRVLTYNILADLYADSDYTRQELFPYCSPAVLDIDYRRPLLIKEILGYNADIICLQEVDAKIFEHDLKPMFRLQNLTGLFQQKGNSGEGIATFYKENRFEVINIYGINIGDHIRTLDIFRPLTSKIKNNELLMTKIVNLGTALQVTVLKSKDNDNYVIVANTHLYFHPEADHIRLLQFGFCMKYIENVQSKMLKKFNLLESQISLIFSGDFNSTPDCGIYKLATEKFVDEHLKDWKSNPEEAPQGVYLYQPFNMLSACGCPDYTNYTKLFAACLDYIFYQTDNLDIKEIIPVPTNDALKQNVALPSMVFPSDHIALGAVFKWK